MRVIIGFESSGMIRRAFRALGHEAYSCDLKPSEDGSLPQRLVRALTKPGELVLDPYAGVGSAGIAAALEGRRFLGCEIEAKYAKLANQRYSKLLAGTLQVRDWKRPTDMPNPRQAVAKVPAHFWPRVIEATSFASD